MYATKVKGARYLELAEGYVLQSGSGRGRPDHRLQVPVKTRQDDGRHQEGHGRRTKPMKKNTGTYGRFAERRQVHRPASSSKRGGMKTMALFESYERRIDKINACPRRVRHQRSIEECRSYLQRQRALMPMRSSRACSPSRFENARLGVLAWARPSRMKKGVKTAAEAAEAIGIGLQAFCIPGSVAEQRKVGLGHGNLGAMLLRRRDQVLLPSWPATSPLPPRKARSASPATPTRPARSPCASS